VRSAILASVGLAIMMAAAAGCGAAQQGAPQTAPSQPSSVPAASTPESPPSTSTPEPVETIAAGPAVCEEVPAKVVADIYSHNGEGVYNDAQASRKDSIVLYSATELGQKDGFMIIWYENDNQWTAAWTRAKPTDADGLDNRGGRDYSGVGGVGGWDPFNFPLFAMTMGDTTRDDLLDCAEDADWSNGN